jgi:hypothetical protein
MSRTACTIIRTCITRSNDAPGTMQPPRRRPIEVYDTSAAGLSRRLSNDPPSWDEPDGHAEPTADEIYSLKLPGGNEYQLVALHVMTRQLEHWAWVSLWWSPEPDVDFGADRPASLPPPFDHYKLCSVVDFEERDTDPAGGFDDDAPSLAAALRVTHTGVGGATWCSNPYVERDVGAAATNCMGCHQHAGSGLSARDVLADERRFPDHGRRPSGEPSAGDYAFGVRLGEDLGGVFLETERLYAAPRASDP